jgi:hypothetical protein
MRSTIMAGPLPATAACAVGTPHPKVAAAHQEAAHGGRLAATLYPERV